MRKTKEGMDLTIAELKYAYKKLTGTKTSSRPDGGNSLVDAGNEMYAKYGPDAIAAALADFDVRKYVETNEYDI